LIKNANADLLRDLLPVLDDFDRAIKANETNDDMALVKEGFGLISQKFFNLLQTKGLKPLDALGKDFNVDHHEALTQIPVQKKKQKGKVVEVVEKGYFLNDNVLRYSKVVVGS
jgi:molecular chaperone GrpE